MMLTAYLERTVEQHRQLKSVIVKVRKRADAYTRPKHSKHDRVKSLAEILQTNG